MHRDLKARKTPFIVAVNKIDKYQAGKATIRRS
jgi:translation initiation factor IF-2